MREILIIIIFAFFYALISLIFSFYIERKKDYVLLSRKIEKLIKNKELSKVYECYLKLFRFSLRYLIINFFIGLLIIITLSYILKGFEFYLPFVNLKVRWFFIYAVFVMFFSLIFKYLYNKSKFLKYEEKKGVQFCSLCKM